MTEPINVKALFLGPKSENYTFFKEMLNYLMDDHAQWRQYFHPDDAPVVTGEEQGRPGLCGHHPEDAGGPHRSGRAPSAQLHALVLAPLPGAHVYRHPHGRKPRLHADPPVQPEQLCL